VEPNQRTHDPAGGIGARSTTIVYFCLAPAGFAAPEAGFFLFGFLLGFGLAALAKFRRNLYF